MRFRYATNGGTEGEDINAPVGLFLDDIAVTAGEETIFRDGAENGDNGWSSVRFRRIGSSSSRRSYRPLLHRRANRTYVSYDRYLKTGPYNLRGRRSRPQRRSYFPYQNGLLVNYWDTHYVDNNTSVHPGRGLVLPIDAHPTPFDNPDGDPWRGRIQTYDAPFSLERADSLVLRHNGRPSYVRGAAAQPLFDDTRSYWNAELPNVGVKSANAGVTLRVVEQSGTSMTVQVGPVRPTRRSGNAAPSAKTTKAGPVPAFAGTGPAARSCRSCTEHARQGLSELSSLSSSWSCFSQLRAAPNQRVSSQASM